MENFIANDKTPLGARYNDETKNIEFRLYSKNATKVFLCIFDKPQGEEAIMTLNMEKTKDDIWYTEVKDYVLNCQKRPVYYGYRLFGPNWQYNPNFELGSDIGFNSKFDGLSNRFNPNKIAYDPYCLELSHLPSDVNPGYNLFRSGAKFHLGNNAKWAPKSVFFPKKEEIMEGVSLRPFVNEIIAEVHLKDLTQRINMLENGTYLGASKFAKTIKNLGVTMIEFLPLNEYDSKQNGFNHWGYMPLGYFTLAKRYAFNKTDGSLLYEFRSMINEFHKNDIKVCMDMVYNHTGEAGLINNNPDDAILLSYALIDNASYYKTYSNGYYRSNSGCGNDFNISSPASMNLVADSIAFFASQGVDAFRFDLAAALLENSCDCDVIYDNINSLAAKLKDMLKQRNVDVIDDFNVSKKGIVLIAEPWTCGGDKCYQLGNFPSFWAEWNDISRDTFRKITIRPNEITPKQIREVFEGTPSKFKNNKSINYIASHDGFSLYDLNTYITRNPTTQGGSEWEICSNYSNSAYAQENAIRKQLALLFLSYGIPMIQLGDIIMHSKLGNNNSFNKDDAINYLNWDKATRKDSFENRIMEYIRNLINFRKDNPIFCDKNFKKCLTYHYDNGEIADFNNLGYWNNVNDKFFGVMINEGKNRLYIASNKSNDRLDMILPKVNTGFEWQICLDTSDFSYINITPRNYIEKNYILNSQALALFMEIKK